MPRGSADSREHLLAIPGDEETKHTEAVKIKIVRLERLSDEGARILNGVSLEVQGGQILGIIGPSGSGKSTILRAINRLWEPASGTVFVDGEDITRQSVLTVRRRCGMLFQTPMLFDGTVADNINYGPRLQGKSLDTKEVERLLRLADLDPTFAMKSVIGLSVGQAQRVALARTLANRPEVLLLDEPTSALDPISTKHIEETVLGLRESQGLTVLIVSHSIEQVRRIADVVCLVVNGEVVEVIDSSNIANAKHPLAQEYLAATSVGA